MSLDPFAKGALQDAYDALPAQFKTIDLTSKFSRMDLMKALALYYNAQRQAQGSLLPGRAWLAENVESPMLAQSTGQHADALNYALTSTNYVAEEKYDGARCLIFYTPEYGFEFYSRNRSVTDYFFGDYTNQIRGLEGPLTAGVLRKSFCLDSELTSINPSVNGRIVTETVLQAVVSLLGLERADSHVAQEQAGYPLRFNVFDILMFDGKSLMGQSLARRKEFLDGLLPAIQAKASVNGAFAWFLPVKWYRFGADEKQAFFKEVTARGGEGLILKNLEAPYNPVEARGGNGAAFLKMKRTISGSLGDYIDAFIIDGEPGDEDRANANIISRIHFGVYMAGTGEVHEIACISGFDQATKQAMTTYDGQGKPILNPAFKGKVAAIEGQDFSSRSKAMVHARFIRWREGADAKTPEQCVMTQAQLAELVL